MRGVLWIARAHLLTALRERETLFWFIIFLFYSVFFFIFLFGIRKYSFQEIKNFNMLFTKVINFYLLF